MNDLKRNSLLTQTINDEFPQYCSDLQLVSFYETLPMSYGTSKSLIADKDLATLGYANERTECLHANHREVCEYSSFSDPNYKVVRNALATMVYGLQKHLVTSRRQLHGDQRRQINAYLGISDAPEDDLMTVDQRRMEGSCEWLTRKESFHQWQNAGSSPFYWVSAKPASGKSVLSGHVIQHLKSTGHDCSFYFFKRGVLIKCTIGYFLRSIAWQMANGHSVTTDAILGLCEREDQLEEADYLKIWRKLFLETILKKDVDCPRFIVIDGLDECKMGSELVSFLLKMTDTSSIRGFRTSRDRFDAHRQAPPARKRVVQDEVLASDTNSDIEMYLDAHMKQLPLPTANSRQLAIEEILNKSSGCFFWVHLVLRELEQVHTATEVHQVLDRVPADMDDLYSMILVSIAQAQYGKHLAKAILIWTVCAARPMTTGELYHALQIDIKESIDDLRKLISAVCGQLIYVDTQSRVKLVHLTARDFLIQQTDYPDFLMNKRSGHKRLALSCVQYLNGNEMRGPRHRKLNVGPLSKERCEFASYACQSLSEHIAHVDSADDEILLALALLSTSPNVLHGLNFLFNMAISNA